MKIKSIILPLFAVFVLVGCGGGGGGGSSSACGNAKYGRVNEVGIPSP